MISNPGIASIPIREEWIDEAGEELEGYKNQPFLPPFMEHWSLNPNATRTLAEKIAEIEQCILDPRHSLRLDDLAGYLDELKFNGKQFVFLWRLKSGNQGYLARLAETPERGELVWETDEPVLAEVSCSDVLRFKWVFTRRYHVAEPPEVEGEPPVFTPRTQRAVTFFRVHLTSGNAELRIQSLPEGIGLPSHREEFKRYRALVEKVVELGRFSRVAVEPVASHWLAEPIRGLVPTTWQVARPSGEILRGGGKHVDRLARKLELLFGRHSVKKATFRWNCSQNVANHPLYLTLDGTGNAVDFNGRADSSRVDFLLDLIRHDQQPAPKSGGLVGLAERSAKRRGHPRASRLASPIAWTITPLILYLAKVFVSWLGSYVTAALGDWLVVAEVALVLALWALHFVGMFGRARVKSFALRLWRPAHLVISWAVGLLGGDGGIWDTLDKMYAAWPDRRPDPIPLDGTLKHAA